MPSHKSLAGDVDSASKKRRGSFQQSALHNITSGKSSSRMQEISQSLFLMKNSKMNVLLVFAPLAFYGSMTAGWGEFQCFCFAGIALIPLAERLSFVTENVAEHTNETIGALLNATFGNAPELLISSAALRSGFYRVVQLTLLGSVLTNLLFVFGISCFVGGLRWQTQTLRITSGNVSIGMLLTACMGLVLPAALKLANESASKSESRNEITDGDVAFSRFNSVVMVLGYICYLIFQLGSHKEEFDFSTDVTAFLRGDDDFDNDVIPLRPLRPNQFCRRYCFFAKYRHNHESQTIKYDSISSNDLDIEMTNAPNSQRSIVAECSRRNNNIPQSQNDVTTQNDLETSPNLSQLDNISVDTPEIHRTKSKTSDIINLDDFDEMESSSSAMTMRCGLVWLAVVTIVISLMSNIVVDSIDGFAARSTMSEVFTSVIIIPFFSNLAEQVSAIIFAYKNKMDLCIGVTVGSAIQIAQLVMPLTCLWAWVMGRRMTLYFRAYETICFLLGVLCVAAALQIGTTNWLVGCYLLSVYFMIAAGFFFHENEDISIDEEI